MANLLGDLEISDPRTMRALAHPVRLAILERLQRAGPATASELAPEVGATASVTSWHLRHLAGHGLVRDSSEPSEDRRTRRWEAVARGFRFEVPDGPDNAESTAAARQLSEQLFRRNAQLPLAWLAETEPQLRADWRRLAGAFNTRVVLSAEELAALSEAFEALLAPYVTRPVAEQPADGRAVRVLRYVLPEAAPEPEAGPDAVPTQLR